MEPTRKLVYPWGRPGLTRPKWQRGKGLCLYVGWLELTGLDRLFLRRAHVCRKDRKGLCRMDAKISLFTTGLSMSYMNTSCTPSISSHISIDKTDHAERSHNVWHIKVLGCARGRGLGASLSPLGWFSRGAKNQWGARVPDPGGIPHWAVTQTIYWSFDWSRSFRLHRNTFW